MTESRPRRVRHVPSCFELCSCACARMRELSIDTDREVSSTCRAPVRVGCAAVRFSRVRRARPSARDRVAPATSYSRSELFRALLICMRAYDRAEHRYRSRSQLCMSSSGPRLVRGYEVLARAPRSAARARDRVAPATNSSRDPCSLELCPWTCARMIRPRIGTDREVSSACRAPVRVRCAAVRCSRARD